MRLSTARHSRRPNPHCSTTHHEFRPYRIRAQPPSFPAGHRHHSRPSPAGIPRWTRFRPKLSRRRPAGQSGRHDPAQAHGVRRQHARISPADVFSHPDRPQLRTAHRSRISQTASAGGLHFLRPRSWRERRALRDQLISERRADGGCERDARGQPNARPTRGRDDGRRHPVPVARTGFGKRAARRLPHVVDAQWHPGAAHQHAAGTLPKTLCFRRGRTGRELDGSPQSQGLHPRRCARRRKIPRTPPRPARQREARRIFHLGPRRGKADRTASPMGARPETRSQNEGAQQQGLRLRPAAHV